MSKLDKLRPVYDSVYSSHRFKANDLKSRKRPRDYGDQRPCFGRTQEKLSKSLKRHRRGPCLAVKVTNSGAMGSGERCGHGEPRGEETPARWERRRTRVLAAVRSKRAPAPTPCGWAPVAEQTCPPAPRHAGVLDAEAKPDQKERSLQLRARQRVWIQAREKKGGDFLEILNKILMPGKKVQKATTRWDFPTSAICRISGDNVQNRQNVQDIRSLAIHSGHPKLVPHGMCGYQQLKKFLNST